MMCVEGSSPSFLSNFGIFDNILDGIVDQYGSWEIGSFVNRNKSGKSSVARKGNGVNEDWKGGEVFSIPDGPCDPPCWYYLRVGELLKSECLVGWWHLQEHDFSQNQKLP
jgi:hypothetical protein